MKRNMQFKKVIAGITAISMMASSCIGYTVYADDSVSENDIFDESEDIFIEEADEDSVEQCVDITGDEIKECEISEEAVDEEAFEAKDNCLEELDINADVDISDEKETCESDAKGTSGVVTPLNAPTTDAEGNSIWDCIYFGSYWQNDTNKDGVADKNDEKEPIKWRVLAVSGNEALILADKALDCMPYNTEYEAITWEKCTLRSWLNGYDKTVNSSEIDYADDNFIKNAFSDAEQAIITVSEVKNNDGIYPSYDTDEDVIIPGGNDTVDKVFLLSKEDINNSEYGFGALGIIVDDSTKAKVTTFSTQFAYHRGAYTAKNNKHMNGCLYWLRSPGSRPEWAAAASWYLSSGISDNDEAVRPMMKIRLDAGNYSDAGRVKSQMADPDGKYMPNLADYDNDTMALDAPTGKINNLVVDFAKADEYDLSRDDLIVSVLKGSKIVIPEMPETISLIKNAMSAKIDKKHNRVVLTPKKSTFATVKLSDGRAYTLRISVWKPEVSKFYSKLYADKKEYSVKVRELFCLGVDTGTVKLTAKGTDAYVDETDRTIHFTRNPGASVKVEYTYLNKKYKTTIKMEKN